MAEVFAGFVVGYALAILVSPVAAIALVRSNDRTGFAQQIAPEGTNIVALSMVVHLAAMIVLTAIGLVLGMALAGIETRRPDGGMGSPNVVYTVLVVALTASLVIPALAIAPIRRYAIVFAFAFVTLFGWAMPWLATAG